MKKIFILLTFFLYSFAPNKSAPNDYLNPAMLNGNGRFSTFISKEKIIKDVNNIDQIYLKDHISGQISLISEKETSADAPCFSPTISYDGRFITFLSAASNLDSGAGNLFLYDQATTTLVKINLNYHFKEAQISGNGQAIALVASVNNIDQVFYYLLSNNMLLQLTKGNNHCQEVAINYQGNKISFTSSASNLTNDIYFADSKNVFFFDISQNKITLISKYNDASCQGECRSSQINSQGILFLNWGTNFGIQQLAYFNFAANQLQFINSDNKIDNFSSDSWGNYIVAEVNHEIALINLLNLELKLISSHLPGTKYRPQISGDGLTMIYIKENKYFHSQIDTSPPEISFIGRKEIIVGTIYDPVVDLQSSDDFSNCAIYIIDDGNYNYLAIGEYTLVVMAQDEFNNQSILTFTIAVLEELYPIYAGPAQLNVRINSNYASIKDKLYFIDDLNTILDSYIVDSDVVFDKVGKYRLIIGAKNRFDKETKVEVKIKIVSSIIGDFSLITIPIVALVVGAISYFIIKYKPQPPKEKKRLAPISQYWKV